MKQRGDVPRKNQLWYILVTEDIKCKTQDPKQFKKTSQAEQVDVCLSLSHTHIGQTEVRESGTTLHTDSNFILSNEKLLQNKTKQNKIQRERASIWGST